MREGTQFEFEAKKRAEEQRKSLPSPGRELQPQEASGDRARVAGGVSLSPAPPQLPTVPVPAASLAAAASAAGRVTMGGLQHQLVTSGPAVTTAAAAAGQMSQLQHQLVTSPGVTTAGQMSQLAAQLARPSPSTLPTYSQAVGAAPGSGGLVTSLQTSGSPLRQRTSEAASPGPQLLTSPGPPHQSLASPCEGSGSGALSALLADTPAADKPLPAGSSGSSGNSLLERLVSGGQQPHAVSVNSNLSPAASQLPSVQSGPGHGASNGSGEEITLQSLLSHPAKVQSPSKVSPLLQQLQQPVQSGSVSPRSCPGLTSPRAGVTSPRPGHTLHSPLQSPRPLNPPPSPSSRAGPMSALQQQLMQPPAPRYPVHTSHSILSAHLTAPPRNSNTTATAQSQIMTGLVVSNTQQHAAQPGQVVSVALADQNSVAANGSGGTQQTVQLVNQQPVQLVSNMGQQVQLVNQPQLQVVNHHVNNVQLVNSSAAGSAAAGAAVQLVNPQGNLQQVQLVNQVGGAGAVGGVAGPVPGQIMVNNVPMQLSISPHPVQFSVALAQDSAQASTNTIATLANGVTPPLLVSGAAQPGNTRPQPGLVTSSLPCAGTVTVTSMASLGSLGKLVTNGPNGAPATVLLQSAGGGNILLPHSGGVAKVGGGAGGGASQGGVIRPGQVMVRQQGQQSPVLVQLPSGQHTVSC